MRSFHRSSLVSVSLLAAVFAVPFAAGITPTDLYARLKANEPVLIVDVRPTTIYAQAHIPGAISVPVSLLPYKPLPPASLIVVYADGLGLVDDAKAASLVQTKTGTPVETLTGGFAAWLGETRLSTGASGIGRESIPGISYDQLVAATKTDVVLVDLREPAAAAAVRAQTANPAGTTPATTDLVDGFAQKLGVPVVKTQPQATLAGAKAQVASIPITMKKAFAAAAVEALDHSGKLLVLVADDEATANETARQLRSRGVYRFTILIGGTEAIRREGKTGTGRLSGGTYAGQPQP